MNYITPDLLTLVVFEGLPTFKKLANLGNCIWDLNYS